MQTTVFKKLACCFFVFSEGKGFDSKTYGLTYDLHWAKARVQSTPVQERSTKKSMCALGGGRIARVVRLHNFQYTDLFCFVSEHRICVGPSKAKSNLSIIRHFDGNMFTWA